MSAWNGDPAFDRRGDRAPQGPVAQSVAVRELIWEVSWALAALAVITLWTEKRGSELAIAQARAHQQVAQRAGVLNRLSTPELVERERYTRKLSRDYLRLVSPVSWGRVLARLGRAVPAGETFEKLEVSAPLPAPEGAPAAITLKIGCARPEEAAAQLRGEPYLAEVFGDIAASPVTARTVTLTVRTAREGAP